MKSYIVFKISSKPFLPDVLSGLLWELNIEGITENDEHLIVFANEESNINEETVKELLNNLVAENVIKEFSVKSKNLEEKNWNELWEKSREVIRISERIVIKPTFKGYESKEDEIVISLDPKMSFGTGEHESTKLVLQLLEKHISGNEKILDVGSGTGILSIASVKLGAPFAIAVDSDEWCYENCRENCKLNNVNDSIKIIHGEGVLQCIGGDDVVHGGTRVPGRAGVQQVKIQLGVITVDGSFVSILHIYFRGIQGMLVP